MARKIIQTIVFEGNLVVLSDDGILWSQAKSANGQYWSALPTLPQLPLEELVPNGVAHEKAAEMAAEDLAADLLMDEDGDSVATASPKSGRGVPGTQQEKAPVPGKTKPKPAIDEEDAVPRVPRKYWAILGGLGAILAVYLLWPSAVRSPATLASVALAATDPKEAVAAVVELNGVPGPETLALLRRVAKESTEPEVVAIALTTLYGRGDGKSLNTFLDYLDSEAEKVRQVAFKGAAAFMNVRAEDYPFLANDPADTRAPVVKSLRDLQAKRLKAIEAMSRAGAK